MALIFEKNAASGDKAIVLEPREALLLPFDVGLDWTVLRLGVFCTFVSSENPNIGLSQTETINSNILSRNTFYFGLKDSGNLLPLNTGTYFAGWSATPLNADEPNQIGTNDFIQGNFNYTHSLSGTVIIDQETVDRFYHFRRFADLTTGFCGFNVLEFRRTTGYSGALSYSSLTSQISDVSLDALRARIAASSFNYSFDGCSGYFPPELNSVYIYSPFNDNRLRIHNVCVERYA